MKYNVYSNDKKATLLFPYNFTTTQIRINKSNYIIGTDFLIHKSTTTSSDIDYVDSQITVSSTSKNILNSYNHFFIGYSQKIFIFLEYQYYSFTWKDTIQNNQIYYGSNLGYKSTQYILKTGYNFKIDYLTISPFVLIGYISNKDLHYKRNFYTLQENKTQGYGIKFLLEKKINNYSFFISALIQRQFFNSTMKYYDFEINYNYLNLDSNYKNISKKLFFGVTLKY